MLPSSTDLIYFQEVATELHFSHAAKKLNVSQPSLSLAIKRLESALETILFIRHKQGVTLTRAGAELFKEVKKLLTQWDQTVSNIRNVNDDIKGVVNIGCHSTLAPFMSKMVAELFNKYPELEIHFQHESSIKIVENVVNGNLDIGLVIDPYPHAELILQKISETEFSFWVSSQHADKINLFAEKTLIICDPQLGQTQYLIKQLLKIIPHKELKLSAMNRIEAIAAMVVEGYGVGILPSAFTGRYYGDKLKKIPDSPIYRQPLCLAHRPENKKVMAIQIVLKAIKSIV